MGKRSQAKKRRRTNSAQTPRPSRFPLTVVDAARNMVTGHLPPRECGGCTACCTEIGVESLGKPHQCRCEHQTSSGCGIYPGRPPECRTYLCLWRMGIGKETDRPDRSGVLLTLDSSPFGKPHCLSVFETRPDAMMTRFPDPEEILQFLPEDSGAWDVVLVPFGTAFLGKVEPSPRYADTLSPKGKTNRFLTAGGPMSICVGIVDENGVLHKDRNESSQ